MLTWITQRFDNPSYQAISELAKMFSSDVPDIEAEELIKQIISADLQNQVTGICYNPFYETTFKAHRLRVIEWNPFEDSQRERALGNLLRHRIQVYQRGNYDEFYITYLRYGEPFCIDTIYKLDRFCTTFEAADFWSPNFNDGKYWRVCRDWERTQLESHPEDGIRCITKTSQDVTLTTSGILRKKFTRCTLSATSHFLERLSKQNPKSFYISDPSVNTAHSRLFKLKGENQHLLVELYNPYENGAKQVFIGTGGVWIHRATTYVRPTRRMTSTSKLSDGALINLSYTNYDTYQTSRTTKPIVLENLPISHEIPSLGLYRDPDLPFTLFRTISPWMVLPTEADRMTQVAQETLNMLPNPVFNIVQNYWNLATETVPSVW